MVMACLCIGSDSLMNEQQDQHHVRKLPLNAEWSNLNSRLRSADQAAAYALFISSGLFSGMFYTLNAFTEALSHTEAKDTVPIFATAGLGLLAEALCFGSTGLTFARNICQAHKV